jgi:hypothetical protein
MNDKLRFTDWLDPMETWNSQYGENITALQWCDKHIELNPDKFEIVIHPETKKIALARK